MPYFVYHISIHPETGVKTLKHLATFDKYPQARELARAERAKLPRDGSQDCRMILANNEIEAEKLLSQPRETRVVGED